MKRMTYLLLAALLAPAVASAEPKTAAEWFKVGEDAYNLGNFTEAITAFKKAFELENVESNKAVYLYNIAQSYRFIKDCTNALFFYKRFLTKRDEDRTKPPLDQKKRTEIETRITEQEECVAKQNANAQKPPTSVVKPGEDGRDSTTDTSKDPKEGKPKDKVADTTADPDADPDEEGGNKVVAGLEHTPRVISLRLVGGGAKVQTGSLEVPVQVTGAVIGGYPLRLDALTLELGAGFTFTPVPFENMTTKESKTAQLMGLVANVGATYAVMPKLGIRGDLGVGLLVFAGADRSPFTDNAPAGTLSMFHVRVGLSADYALTPNVVATLAPIAYSYSPAKEGLRDDIKSIQSFDFMLGIGYRM